MVKLEKSVKRSIILFALLALLVSLFVLLLFTPYQQESLWKNYHLLLYREAGALTGEEFIQKLSQITGSKRIISMESEKVAITTFSGMETLPLKALYNRLDSQDPRLDPYILSLKNWFELESQWKALYLNDRGPLLKLYLALEEISSSTGYEVRLPEFDPVEKIIALTVAWLFLAVFLLSGRKTGFKGLMLISTLSWCVYLLSGTLYDLLAFCIITPFFYRLVKELSSVAEDIVVYKWKRIQPDKLLLEGIKYLLALLFTGALISRIVHCRFPLVPVIGNWIAAAGYLSVYFLLKRKKPHRLFKFIKWTREPVQGEFRLNFRNIGFILFFLFVMVVTPFYYFVRSGKPDIRVPVPEVLSGSPGLSLRASKSGAPGNGVPDLSDYIAHRAYQEGLAFGSDYGIPKELGLKIPRFQEKGEGVELFYSSPISFDQLWLAKVEREIHRNGNSIEGLLLDQKAQIVVDLKPLNILYRIKYLYWKDLSIAVCFILPLFILYFYLTPSVLYVIRNLLLRRRHRAA